MSMEQYVYFFTYPNLHEMNILLWIQLFFLLCYLPHPLIALNLSHTNFTILMNVRQTNKHKKIGIWKINRRKFVCTNAGVVWSRT